eukprot:gene9151-9319_t
MRFYVCNAGAMGQGNSTEECDPVSAGTSLVDLAEDIGTLACRVPPSVNITQTMSALTGTISALTLEELQKLPAYLEVMLSVPPKALVISRAQLERLSPLLGGITAGQVNILVTALNVLPEHAWDQLIILVRGLGPVTDSFVTIKQTLGFFPAPAPAPQPAPAPVPLAVPVQMVAPERARMSYAPPPVGAYASAYPVQYVPYYSNARGSYSTNAMPPSLIPSPFNRQVPLFGRPSLFGRKMLQEAPAPAADSSTNSSSNSSSCDAGMLGIEIGVALVDEFGKVVCQFGADALSPVLKELLDLLNKQSTETLGQLPELVDALTRADPKLFSVFFQIPVTTLQELIPVVATLDGPSVQDTLQILGSQDYATISNLVYFLQVAPASSIQLLLPAFEQLTDSQVDTVIKLVNALSPGQITLTLHLLSTFGFAIDAIGQAIPSSNKRGSSFFIGPVKVILAPSSGGIIPGPHNLFRPVQNLMFPFFG